MEIRIQAINFDASEQLEAFIEKKVSKLQKFFDDILSAEVTLKVIKPE
jgi:putative sigma-54 modulation protein